MSDDDETNPGKSNWLLNADLHSDEGDEVPLGIGAATEMRPPPSTDPGASSSLYEPTCYACGQVTPSRDGSVSDPPLPSIAKMSGHEVDFELMALIDEARRDERGVLLFIARRLVAVGQRSYGALDIATDRRNMVRERNEEIGDLLVYSAIEAIKTEMQVR